ncbi:MULTISPECIES: hypothetical protein [Sphingomonas]|uniref:Uncharacterized protein n=1 Tax=Sphingomonas leidyi TaxID=68569 RepID=A0A7X5UWW9_9SPHN|nr:MULTISPECIES: hypothetical protein [Sphingomonas]NIJ63727.1 hypothetical protein [Sphingomonas leidyi]
MPAGADPRGGWTPAPARATLPPPAKENRMIPAPFRVARHPA